MSIVITLTAQLWMRLCNRCFLHFSRCTFIPKAWWSFEQYFRVGGLLSVQPDSRVCGWILRYLVMSPYKVFWPFKWKLLSSTFLWYCEYYAVQCGSNFWACDRNPYVWPFKWKLLSSTFLWSRLWLCAKWFKLLCLWMKLLRVIIQMKAIEQYFPVVLLIMLYKVAWTFLSVNGSENTQMKATGTVRFCNPAYSTVHFCVWERNPWYRRSSSILQCWNYEQNVQVTICPEGR